MSYRCQVCLSISQPQKPMLRHVVTRINLQGNLEIAREIQVCLTCYHDLNQSKSGQQPMSVDELIDAHRFTRISRLEMERARRRERKTTEEEILHRPRVSQHRTISHESITRASTTFPPTGVAPKRRVSVVM